MVSGEKRNCEEENALEKVTAILLDIEGTTTSISFVKDILFPYVRENLEAYVNDHWNDDEFKAVVKALKAQAEKDAEEKIENLCPIEEGEKEKETLIKNVLWQMDLDRKTTALKQLQGHIWRTGYESGKLKGHVYGEVAQVLRKWGEDGRKLYIYSSGSVEAQKLLFKNSESGDLSEYLSGYFDTEVGPKTEASSYMNIAKAVGCDPGQILFLTDVVKEAVAADKAGMQVMIVVREGNAPLTEDEKKPFSTVSSLRDVPFESSSKKKKICEEDGGRKPSSEKAENAEPTQESTEMKNGDPEKMETDLNEPQTEDCSTETNTEQNGPTDMETTDQPPPPPESENIHVDVDDSAPDNQPTEKPPTATPAGGPPEEPNEPTQPPKQPETPPEEPALPEPDNDHSPAEDSGDAKQEQQQNSVNGHENGHLKGDAQKENAPAEETANGDAGAETDAVAVKKVAAAEEPPADSAVEVTA